MYTEISIKENHIVTIENFVEKYLPMKVLGQVTEIMNEMLEEGSSALAKLGHYQKKEQKNFVQGLLIDEGIPDLMAEIERM